MTGEHDDDDSSDTADNGSQGVTIRPQPQGIDARRSDALNRTHIVLANLGRLIAQQGQLRAKQDVKRSADRRGKSRGKR